MEDEIIGKEEGSTHKMSDEIEEIKKRVTVKEKVMVLFFLWSGKDDISLERRIGSEKVKLFFDRIKEMEKETGIRVSLFMITTSGKELASKRLEYLKEKAKAYDLPRLVEGAFGGYSSFKIDSEGNIQDLAIMSEENRNKIIDLLASIGDPLSKDIIEESEKNYIRYQISDKTDKSIDYRYLGYLISKRVRPKSVAKHALRFFGFIEGRYSGIDVLLESQFQGITEELKEYYLSKYDVVKGKKLIVKIDDIDSIDNFINKKQKVEQSGYDEPDDK